MSSFSDSDKYSDPRRGQLRLPARLRVHYGVESADRNGFAENLSESGLYILTNRIYKVGTRLELICEFPERCTYHRGEVMWAIQVPEHMKKELVHGMGIQFTECEADWKKFYRRWNEQLVRLRA